MPGLLLLRREPRPSADGTLPDTEVLTDLEALLARLRSPGAGIRWVALAGDLEDPAGAARRIREAAPNVGILLIPEGETSLGQLASLARDPEDVSRIAHDMGTPLNAILGYAELLEKSAGDDKGRKRAATIIDQVHRLSALVEKLLERGS